jgi:23S rRNA pseudouridine1911/1915/1917 synthase
VTLPARLYSKYRKLSACDLRMNVRLDQYVAQQLPEISRASAAKLIDQGKVTVNGQAQQKAGYKLRPDDQIKISYSPNEVKIPEIELPVIYEDNDCVVIIKPVGLLTHSKGAFNPEATVATWLSGRVKGLGGERAGIVHRLDRATSGVMICAKNPEALAWLQKQFSQRRTKKTYMAVVEGSFREPEAIIDMPIERNPKKPQTFRVGSNGKLAVTHYKMMQTDGNFSLVELRPETGRTHQLRVHMKEVGHPIAGDSLYGGKPAERLFLHAQSLEITLPDKKRETFWASTPENFLKKVSV